MVDNNEQQTQRIENKMSRIISLLTSTLKRRGGNLLVDHTCWRRIMCVVPGGVAVTLFLIFSPVSFANISTHDATQAILGEARGEGYHGMLAVAGALRNRNSLKGVYGFNAKFFASPRLRKLARAAWEESATNDISLGATVWGNAADIKIFKKTKWFKAFKQTIQVGNHYFFKQQNNKGA